MFERSTENISSGRTGPDNEVIRMGCKFGAVLRVALNDLAQRYSFLLFILDLHPPT